MIERKWLRVAAKNALVGQTRAGNNVENSRVNPVQQKPASMPGGREEFPIICIYTRTTSSRVFDESPRRYRHEVELVIECLQQIEKGVTIDEALDAFEQEVLNVILLDETLGGAADDLIYTGSTNVIDGDGHLLIGAVVITFNAIIYTTVPFPGTQNLDSLRAVYTEHSLGGEQEQAERAVTIIEGLDQ